MKLTEVTLVESVSFSVVRLVDKDGQKYYTDPFEKQVKKPCWACDATGRDYDQTCGYCDGKKEVDEWTTDYDTLNVANGNLGTILDMLGVAPEEDYTGLITKDQLPHVYQRLMRLKQQSGDQFTSDTEVSQHARHNREPNSNVSQIQRGPKMYNIGRTNEQVTRYIDVLLKMVKFAQQHDCEISYA